MDRRPPMRRGPGRRRRAGTWIRWRGRIRLSTRAGCDVGPWGRWRGVRKQRSDWRRARARAAARKHRRPMAAAPAATRRSPAARPAAARSGRSGTTKTLARGPAGRRAAAPSRTEQVERAAAMLPNRSIPIGESCARHRSARTQATRWPEATRQRPTDREEGSRRSPRPSVLTIGIERCIAPHSAGAIARRTRRPVHVRVPAKAVQSRDGDHDALFAVLFTFSPRRLSTSGWPIPVWAI